MLYDGQSLPTPRENWSPRSRKDLKQHTQLYRLARIQWVRETGKNLESLAVTRDFLYFKPLFNWTAIPLRFEILVKTRRIVAETTRAQQKLSRNAYVLESTYFDLLKIYVATSPWTRSAT